MASITERNGSYRVTVSMGRDVYGKQIVKTATYKPEPGLTGRKKQKAVEAFAYDFEQRCRNGKVMDGERITLKEFTTRWKAEEASQKLQPGTMEKYNAIIDDFILPSIGHLKMSELKPHTVNSFFLSLTKDGCRHDGKPGGYAKGTIHKISNVLSSILHTAVEWEVIERNPCEAVRVKAEPTAEKIKFFTPQQAAAFLEYIDHPYTIHTKGHSRVDDTGKSYEVMDYTSTKELPEQIKLLFRLAIYTGMRKGEVLALAWNDVDFENNTVTVSKSAAVVNGQQIVKAPKTRNSYRIISIPQSLTERLRRLHIEQTKHRFQVGTYWQEQGWIFTQDNGKQMSYYTPLKALQDIINRYNVDDAHKEKLPLIPFHGLRHTKATIQIAAGTDVRTVSAIMGHRETSTTMNVYSHSLQTAEHEAVQNMERLLAKQA